MEFSAPLEKLLTCTVLLWDSQSENAPLGSLLRVWSRLFFEGYFKRGLGLSCQQSGENGNHKI